MQEFRSETLALQYEVEPSSNPVLVRRSASNGFAWIPVAVFCAVTLPLILVNYHAARAESDQAYHLRTIHQFIDEWPHFDFRDYPSTTTPGYHLVLATLGHLGFTKIIFLRLIGWLFSLGLVIELTRHASALGHKTAAWICLPFVASLYVVSSAAWILPDNAGWWGVLAVLALALRSHFDWKTVVLGGLLLLVLVWVRQVHIWVAAVLWMAAWLGNDNDAVGRIKRVSAMVLTSIPAFLTVGIFAWMWHGLTPPTISEEIRHGWYSSDNVILKGPNFAVPAAVLAVFGGLSLFFGEFLMAGRDQLSRHAGWIVSGFIGGLIIAIAPHTDYSFGSRSSGLWNIAAHLPAPMHHSILVVPLAGLGGALLVAWGVILQTRTRWIWAMSWAAFLAAQIPNPSAFQRYYEPFCLIMLVLVVVHSRANIRLHRMVWIGPCLLTALLGSVLFISIR